LEDYREQLAEVSWVDKAYENYTSILVERSKIKDECAGLSRNIIVTTNNLEKVNVSLKGVTDQISIYHRNEVAVEANAKVQDRIASYRKAHARLEQELQKCNKDLLEISGKKELYKNQIETLTKTLAEVAELENESDSYQLYLQSVGRDGIPYQVICNAVPEIEKEVNALLSQVVDFTIQFETDGKNIVPYMVYDYGRWAVELSSGYERFVASVALRVGLTNVSNLPKTTCLFIDEGMGALDANNMASMSTLFSALKNNFDFLIIISHIDSVKDMVDKRIEISHDGTLAKISYE
jgi:DNA repair exonuclease SbcCD ATPase subunit